MHDARAEARAVAALRRAAVAFYRHITDRGYAGDDAGARSSGSRRERRCSRALKAQPLSTELQPLQPLRAKCILERPAFSAEKHDTIDGIKQATIRSRATIARQPHGLGVRSHSCWSTRTCRCSAT